MKSKFPDAQPGTLSSEDYYMDGPHLVFTAAYHLKRGSCCNSGCRHCPYENGCGAREKLPKTDRS